MSGVIFLVFFLFFGSLVLSLPAYVFWLALKNNHLSIATVKSVTVLNFKKRSKFSLFPVFVGDVSFFENKKKKNSSHAVEPQKISTRLTWCTGIVFNTKRAEMLLFDQDVPCTLDFYVFKWPFFSRYRGTPVQSFEKLYRNNLTLSSIVFVFVFLLLGALSIRDQVIDFYRFGFVPVEALELTGRLGKTWLMSSGNPEDRVIYEMTLSYLNELCPPSSVRPLCQKRDSLIKILEESSKDPQSEE